MSDEGRPTRDGGVEFAGPAAADKDHAGIQPGKDAAGG